MTRITWDNLKRNMPQVTWDKGDINLQHHNNNSIKEKDREDII